MKPVKQAEILNALLTARSPAVSNDIDDEAAVAETTQRPLRVLLVEDGDANRKLAVGLLQRWGHTIAIAENGALAVDMYDPEKFDLVLMDLQMPVMDGLTATQRIRDAERGTDNHIPIIAMTAHALVGDRERCIEAGMDDYLSKPIRKKYLAAAINAIFNPDDGKDGRVSDAAGRYAEADDEIAPPPQSTQEDGAFTIDLDAAIEVMEGDQDILCAVVEAFITEAPLLLEQLDEAIKVGEQPAAMRAAHTLKGNFRILRQPRQQAMWAEVEDLAKEGRLDELAGPIETARQMTLQSLDQLSRYLEANR
jgi:CheY-like chemotaxis protein